MVPIGRWRLATGVDYNRGEPINSSALSGEYALGSARVEGSSIVDDPGEWWTPVRENQRREQGGF